MTLYRQLIVVIIALFTASFLVSVTISTVNLRSFMEEQFQSHAQDAATSLGLSLSPYMQSHDMAVMNSMVDAIYDRGYYKTISVTTVSGTPLIERSNPGTISGVPSWFVDHVDLRLPAAESVIMTGWKQAATVTVVSHPGYAYQELWKNCRDSLLVFSLTAAAACLIGILAVYLLLKPLKQVETQAEAICQKNFALQGKLPRTRELRRVVKAMNRLAGKLDQIFTDQASLTERLREQAYQDPVTGLGNRRYFDRQFQSSLESGEETSGGTVLLLELSHLKQLNTTSGYQAGDALLHRIAELVQTRLADFRNYFLSRLSGAGFGIVVEDIDSQGADALASSLSRDLLQLHTGQLVGNGNVAHIGLTMWKPGDSMPDVLAEADNALRTARISGNNAWHRFEPATGASHSVPGGVQWHSYLKQAIYTASASLCAQPVIEFTGAEDRLLHKEVFLRLPDYNGNIMQAGRFMPVAEQSGLAAELDRLAIGKLMDFLAANSADTCRYAVNLSASSLHDTALVDWLCKVLQADLARNRRIDFEFPEYGVLRDIRTTRTVIAKLSALGCNCGIDHFGRGFNSFGYLRSLGLQYLKVDGGFTRNIHLDPDNRFLIKALADTAHSVDIRVFAVAVESGEELDAIQALNVDGAQGCLVGKPEFLDNSSLHGTANVSHDDRVDLAISGQSPLNPCI